MPERVVILDNAMLGYLIPLGVKPIGTGGEDEAASVPPPYESLVDYPALPVVAPNFAPNFEAIAAARPDVIFAIDYGEDPDYQRMGQIAPTVVLPSDFDPERRPGIAWVRDAMRTIALALGRPSDGEEPVGAYERKLADLRGRHRAKIEGRTVSYVRARKNGMFRVDGPFGFGGGILHEAGLRRPQTQLDALAAAPQAFPVAAEVSLEQVAIADADLIIVPRASFDKEPLDQNPLFQALPAVREGRYFPVDSDLWFSRSIVGAALVLDDLDRILRRLP
jgi:iron complex transport system substrate-binding protein